MRLESEIHAVQAQPALVWHARERLAQEGFIVRRCRCSVQRDPPYVRAPSRVRMVLDGLAAPSGDLVDAARRPLLDHESPPLNDSYSEGETA